MYHYMTQAETPCDLSRNYNQHSLDYPALKSQPSSSMTELVLTKHSPDAERLLLPMLAHLSRDAERWVTWIYDTPVDRKHLNTYGVNTRRIRFIHSDSDECTRWILWEALSNGTSHTVIATLNELNDEELRLLEIAAEDGGSHGLLIRYR